MLDVHITLITNTFSYTYVLYYRVFMMEMT